MASDLPQQIKNMKEKKKEKKTWDYTKHKYIKADRINRDM